MSKSMFGFLILCSVIMYNPDAVRGFASQHASEVGQQVRQAIYTVDRLLPNFLRFGGG